MYGIYANIGGIWMVNVTIYSIHGSYGICTSPCSIFLRFSQEGALLGARSLRGQPAEDRTYGAFWSGRAGGASASLEGGEDPILGTEIYPLMSS